MQNLNKYIKRAALLTVALIGLISCQKSFLEIVPKGKLIAQTTADYSNMLYSLSLLNITADAQVLMGDDVVASEPDFSASDLRTQRLYQWADVIYDNDKDANEMVVPMLNIYCYNEIINEVLGSTNGTDAQKKSVRAEALAGRAWTYFLLINYYGKPYNAATSATDPGYPIITESDITGNGYKRASVKEVYDFIVSDLTTAIPDLPQLISRLRMSKMAGEGLLGKVYMFMGKFDTALPLLNASFADFGNTVATYPVGLYDYNVAFNTGGTFLPIGMFGPSYPMVPNNQENMYGKQFSNMFTFVNNEILISPQTMALFGSSDLRLKFYSNSYFPDGLIPGGAGVKRRIGPSAVQEGFLVPDLYLLRAECKARLNDLPGAVSDVQALRQKRMPAGDVSVPTETATQQLPLIRFILNERVREFAGQGYRWFDMRRLSVDPLFTTPTYTHVVYSATGTPGTYYTLKPGRLTLRLSQKSIDQNPGMVQNP